MKRLNQKNRVYALGIDAFLIAVICWLAFGAPFPPNGEKGFWYYSALLSVLVGSKIVTPFYVKPADAVSYATPAFVALMLINQWSNWGESARILFCLISSFSASIIILALVAIVLNLQDNERLRSISNELRVVLETFAKPQVIYIPIMIFSMYVFHRDNVTEVIFISIAALLTAPSSFGEVVLSVIYRLKDLSANEEIISSTLEIAAHQQPKIILLRQSSETDIPKGTILYVKDNYSNPKVALALGLVGRDDGFLLRCIEIERAENTTKTKVHLATPSGYASLIQTETAVEDLNLSRETRNSAENIVGIVVTDSSVETIFFEVVDNDTLETGRLVKVTVQGKPVLYQLVGGLTQEETVQKKNTYGFLRAQAQQVGHWDAQYSKFKQFNWLPSPNDPVFIEGSHEYQIEPDTIGHFPESNYQVKIGDINQLVTHNTAILGILGVGKSMLAIELIERMMASGIKVICLDLTNQYETELADYYDANAEHSAIETLKKAAEADKKSFRENPEEGGSLPNLRQAFYNDIQSFINNDKGHLLKIYNPTQFVASKQERAPSSYNVPGSGWQRGAALFSVTPVEVTQIVSEVTLEILSSEMSDKARVCLVYEEAHSLIPEWNSVVNDGDKHATSGTARAILQGRKFGLGCLLITQRTANVTKTVLNQCNTIFAMRTFDHTGKDFLSNYIGKEYAAALSTIKERQAVFFGRGSSCENPVLIAVNDRSAFLRSFRQVNPPPSFDQQTASNSALIKPVRVEGKAGKDNDFFDDDIPF
jgi:hypothetical protein